MNAPIIITTVNELVRVYPERIVYISSDGNYSVMVLHDKTEHLFSFNLSHFQQIIEKQMREDRKIVSNLDAGTRQVIASNGFYNHNCRFSQYYWNDMMRKIVIAQVVPLCISSGYKTRALQLLNYADNRIFNLVNVLHLGHVDLKTWVYKITAYIKTNITSMIIKMTFL